MINYVVGLMFDKSDTNKILLMKKNRPDFQVGRINGIGGKIESFTKISNEIALDCPETPLQAMIREFKEETGVYHDNWNDICSLGDGKTFRVYFFYSYGDVSQAKTITDEELIIIDRNNLPENIMSNLRWIIPMAETLKDCNVNGYEIIEK